MSNRKAPFTSLGKHLKYVREQSNQSLAEVSGAVEIDEKHLERIEAGLERPAEDVLLLLINYFGVKDREAVQLWESADYDSAVPDGIKFGGDTAQIDKSTLVLLAMDPRTIYSDGLGIIVNPGGVTLQFTQSSGQPQPALVAKIGMSHQQAEMVIQSLQTAMLHARYTGKHKLLPPETDKTS